MFRIEEIKEELLNLRGSKVSQFGQTVTLSSQLDDDEIDIIDILNQLSDNEVDMDEIALENGFKSVDDYMHYVFTNYNEIDSNNTYNWNAPIRNHINWRCYDLGGLYLYEVRIQRGYGDVRGNYTDDFYLIYDSRDGFIYDLAECDKYATVEVDGVGYDYSISILSDTYEVYNEDGDYICTAYGDADDVIAEIKNAIA